MSSTDQTTDAPAVEPGQEKPRLLISHTNDEGTLVHGTRREDGSREALRAASFKWSRNLRAWYMPQSRGRAAKRARIDYLKDQLEASGFVVQVEIELYDAVEAFDTLQTHDRERAEGYAERGAREHARSDNRYQAARAAVAGIPPGQPILAGHHSEAHHRRDLARSDRHMRASVEHDARGERSDARSASALARTLRREDPVRIGRRIERLEADQRSLERRLKGAGEAPIRRCELAEITQEIAYLRKRIADSGVKQYTSADLKPGDHVKIRGSWWKVAKANRKTVAVKTAYSWTDKHPYYEVTDHRRPEQPAAPATA
jgi:hypothetical protein